MGNVFICVKPSGVAWELSMTGRVGVQFDANDVRKNEKAWTFDAPGRAAPAAVTYFYKKNGGNWRF